MGKTEMEAASRSTQCAICQIEADKKCTGCNEVAYCGKEHQRKHWSIHKNDCKCWKVIEDPTGVKGRYVLTRITYHDIYDLKPVYIFIFLLLFYTFIYSTICSLDLLLQQEISSAVI